MIIKGATGLVLGSIAVLADAVHSFADIFASFIVYYLCYYPNNAISASESLATCTN
jgi:divalent metal cation (Fe/Co/Zn/Cd) transporter